jgi:hypothetical protein
MEFKMAPSQFAMDPLFFDEEGGSKRLIGWHTLVQQLESPVGSPRASPVGSLKGLQEVTVWQQL